MLQSIARAGWCLMRGAELTQFLDELVSRIQTYVDSSERSDEKTVEFLNASSRMKSTDLILPLKAAVANPS